MELGFNRKKEIIMGKCYDNPEYDDLGNGLQNTWEHSPLKEEQKQHLIDMMNDDEDLGLYNETFDEYLIRLKDRRTEDDYKYTDEDFEKYDEYIMDSWRCGISVYKCLEFMYFAEKEIKVEDVFNDEKREGVKKLIDQHKVLQGLTLVNPSHLQMTSNGHGEFPDGYKLTEKGIQYIIEQLNKE